MRPAPEGKACVGLVRYLYLVAEAVDVGPEAVVLDMADVATARMALSQRSPTFPEFDLTLTWNEENGWALSIEVDQLEAPVVLSYLGVDLLPEPTVVGAFVDVLIEGAHPGQPDFPRLPAFAGLNLERRLAAYAESDSWLTWP